jgi:undecaprenyl-diphosphatase
MQNEPVDAALVLAAHQFASSQTGVAAAIVLVAQTGVFVLPVALVAAWLLAGSTGDRQRKAILVGWCASGLAFATGLLLEHISNRPRPFVEFGFDPLFPHAADTSFPSDHTLVGVALVGPLLWRAPKLGGWLVAWALLVGLARVAAGVHYPTDILGSAVLALGLDVLVWFVTRGLLGRVSLQRWDAGLLGSRSGGRRR